MGRVKQLFYILSSVTFLVFSGCGEKNETSSDLDESIPVETVDVKVRMIERTLKFAGNILAWRETNLGAQTSGRIEKIFVKEGDEVKAGDILVQMDDTQLTQARIHYQIAREDYQRMQPLFEQGSISPQQFDKVKAGYETAESAYELILRNTQLRAPFKGVITAKHMNEGEVFLMMPGKIGPPSIVTIMQIDRLKVMMNVTESDFPDLELGMPAEVTVDIYPGRTFPGKISRIDPVINDYSRTFAVEIKVDNPTKVLRPGMFARVKLVVAEEDVLVAPRSALIRQLGSSAYYCFIVEDGKASRREVKIGLFFDELVEVEEGLHDGDQIVIKGQYRLKDGTPVKLVSATES